MNTHATRQADPAKRKLYHFSDVGTKPENIAGLRIAHDLTNPMQSIVSITDLCLEGKKGAQAKGLGLSCSKLIEEVQIIRSGEASTDFITYLRDHLIDIAKRVRRLQAAKAINQFRNPKLEDRFKTELKHCLLVLDGEWGENISDVGKVFNQVKGFYKISRRLPDHEVDQFKVMMKESELFLVLDNLLANSSDNGSAVATLTCMREALDCVLSFEDDGPGMSEQQALEICSRCFENLKPGQTHDGVGLMLARAAIKTAGGSIEMETAEGLGTLFRIRLPLAEGK